VPDAAELARAKDGTRFTSAVFGWPSAGPEPQPSTPAGAGPEARRFTDEYLKRYGRVPEPYAAQGYEAMAVILASIRRAGDGGDNRADVIEAFFETRSRRSPIGTYSVEPNGNVTLKAIAGLRVAGGRAFLERELQGR
jgi:ABC-type branched-subunit amino acid transport system substrate-binding protein